MADQHLLPLDNLARLAALAKALEKAGGPDDSEAPIILGGIIRRESYTLAGGLIRNDSYTRNYIEEITITAAEARDLIVGVWRELATLGKELDDVLIDLHDASDPDLRPGRSKGIIIGAYSLARRIKSQIKAAFAGE